MATRSKQLTRTASHTSAHTPSNPQERDLFKTFIGSRVTVDIPPNATLEQVEGSLQQVINGHQRAASFQDQVRPIIGRIILEVRERKLFKETHVNFTQWLMAVVVGRMGFSRPLAYYCLSVANSFPHLTEDDSKKYGAVLLREAARITSEDDKDYRAVLDRLAKMSSSEVIAYVKEVQQAATPTNGETPVETKVISIRVKEECFTRWHALREQDPNRTAEELLMDMMDFYAMRQELVPRRATPTAQYARAS